jgi:hypothetical protein
MGKIKLLLAIVFILNSIFASPSHSLKEPTHEAINTKIAKEQVNGFSLNGYLKNNIGYPDGVEELLYAYSEKDNKYDRYSVSYWLGEGGFQEDRPGEWYDYFLNRLTRSVNHFHNPLKDWSEAGLNDIFGLYSGQSSVLWSQNPNQQIGGRWAWPNAREFFYTALTIENKSQRDENFARTFRAVGQLMHLVHDASVPEHTRNDAHVLPAYEAFVEKIRTNNQNKHMWDVWISKPITFDKSILQIASTHALAPVPISRIIDSDKYDGSNPGITVSNAIGLAEYTNANFLSWDTMLTDDYSKDHRHYFPHPNAEKASLWVDHNNNRAYYKKNGDGVAVDHLAVKSLLHNYRVKYFPQENRSIITGYEEYASHLIPRAVGYSAGLLNYFFRGTIEITPPEQYVYSIIDGGIEPQQFTKIKAKLKNTTEDEALLNGSLVAVAKYIKRTDYQPDLSADPPDVNSLPAEFSYSVSAMKLLLPEELASMNAHPTEFIFDFSDDPIPAGITDLSLQVVFKGTLGNEKDNAIAVGYGISAGREKLDRDISDKAALN